MCEIKNVTATIIFEGSALNRDEKIGGNIQSIKKLTIGDKITSFISRPAIRHYLFNTLVESYGWKKSGVRLANKGVLQFDIENYNIQNCEELDVFGYMFTIGDISITRKAPVGITKAISLFPYNQDMALYSNHDLVNRGRQQGLENVQPDLNNREENQSLYKVSFTIDSKMLGIDSFICNEYNDVDKKLTFSYKENNEQKTLEIKIENVPQCQCTNLNNRKKVEISVDPNTKKQRIRQILEVIRNGLVAHSSGEDNTIIPLFMIASAVKVPSPIFHPYIDLAKEDSGYRVVGINDCLNNLWIEDESKIYIQGSERLPIGTLANNDKVTNGWGQFLNQLGIDNGTNNRENSGNGNENQTQTNG